MASARALLLRSAALPGMSVHTIPKHVMCSKSSWYNASLSDQLYNFSSKLIGESREDWQMQADQMDFILMYSSREGVHGFQMWKYDRGDPGLGGAQSIVLRAGKMRIGKEVRGYGLHVLSNLIALETAQNKFMANAVTEKLKFYRIGIMNIHSFSSYFNALASFETRPFNDTSSELARVCNPCIDRWLSEMCWSVDVNSGRIDVRQKSLEQPDDFSEAWWSRPGVEVFRQLHAERRRLTRSEALDPCNDIAMACALDHSNVMAMQQFVHTKLGQTVRFNGGFQKLFSVGSVPLEAEMQLDGFS